MIASFCRTQGWSRAGVRVYDLTDVLRHPNTPTPARLHPWSHIIFSSAPNKQCRLRDVFATPKPATWSQHRPTLVSPSCANGAKNGKAARARAPEHVGTAHVAVKRCVRCVLRARVLQRAICVRGASRQHGVVQILTASGVQSRRRAFVTSMCGVDGGSFRVRCFPEREYARLTNLVRLPAFERNPKTH